MSANEVRGYTFTTRTSVVAFSPDGKHLAATESGYLVVRKAANLVSVARIPLGDKRAISVGFAGAAALGAIVVDKIGEAELRCFRAPTWSRSCSVNLVGGTNVLIGHPHESLAIVSPRDSMQWGRNPSQQSSKDYGFEVYDLDSGSVVGGAGPLNSYAEMLTLTWSGTDAIGVHHDALYRWSMTTGIGRRERDLPEIGTISALQRANSDMVVGWANPPLITNLDGKQRVDLSRLGELLYDLVAQPEGALLAAIVLRSADGRVVALTAQIIEAGGKKGKAIPLSWPLAGVAIHPSDDLLAWVHRVDGHDTLHVTRISSGAELGVPNE